MISVATTFGAKEHERIQEPLRSWFSSGFAVLLVEPKKSYPALSLMRDRLLARPSDIVGITNADIEILCPDLHSRIESSVRKNEALIIPRWNYSPGEARTKDSDGYDVFFMSRDVASKIPDGDCKIGLPCWDLALPLALHAAGVHVKVAANCLVQHLRHPIQWNYAAIARYSHEIVKHGFRYGLTGDTTEAKLWMDRTFEQVVVR